MPILQFYELHCPTCEATEIRAIGDVRSPYDFACSTCEKEMSVISAEGAKQSDLTKRYFEQKNRAPTRLYRSKDTEGIWQRIFNTAHADPIIKPKS